MNDFKEFLENMLGVKLITLEEYTVREGLKPIIAKICETATLWGVQTLYHEDFVQMILEITNLITVREILTLIQKDVGGCEPSCPLADIDLVTIGKGLDLVQNSLKEIHSSKIRSVMNFVKDVDDDTIWKDLKVWIGDITRVQIKKG